MTITRSIWTMACAAFVAGAVLVGASAARSLSAYEARAVLAAGDDIELSGCLLRGEDDNEYLLTNWPADPALTRESEQVSPSAVGTTSSYSTVFYWLYGHDDLKKHVGHRVAVKGDVKDEIRDGEITLDRKDDWTELVVKADGRTLKARVPNTSFAPGEETRRKGPVTVRRVDVDRTTMLGATCQP